MKRTCRALLVALILTAGAIPVGTAEPVEHTDASGQWRYVLMDGSAVITGYDDDKVKELEIAAELDGHAVGAIGDGAFNGYGSLRSITIPDGVVSIGNEAFRWCSGLQTLFIPDSVTAIGDRAFYSNYQISSVTLSQHVTSMGVNPFAQCRGLQTIAVASGNPVYASIDGVLFNKVEKVLVSFPGARSGKYDIPQGILGIGEEAFDTCYSLTGVTIPDSVLTIGKNAFAGCLYIRSIVIPDGVTTIADGAFDRCEGLLSVTIPASVTFIGEEVFPAYNSHVRIFYVEEGSVAHQYAVDNSFPYVCSTDTGWL